MQCYYCLLGIFFISTSVSSTTTCNNLTSLVEALYSTDDNLLELAKVFYPLRQSPAKYVKVTYQFVNESQNETDYCSINYIWASSSFLLIQPPDILQWTSLLFYHKAVNEDENIILTLPAACVHLAPNNCSCKNQTKGSLLNFFTHQVSTIPHLCAEHYVFCNYPLYPVAIATAFFSS